MSNTNGPKRQASYNEGLKIDKYDQKGSYIYGIKENKYLKTIQTKTHVAVFELEGRKDGFGVDNEDGGATNLTSSRMSRIKTIKLYSKADYLALVANPEANVSPIKTAHFVYDYSLCKNIDNNSGEPEVDEDGHQVNLTKGKLTLKKVYFTYKNSNMGKYTPYVFNYSDSNPDYNVKAYDIWGNYKPFLTGSWSISSAETTPQEFPYVDQSDSNEDEVNQNAYSWSLASIELPSGGKIEVDYEADDYQYVQDKHAMQMFKIDGLARTVGSYTPGDNALYSGQGDARYVVVKITVLPDDTPEKIKKRYTEGLLDKPVYFNFLTNLTQNNNEFEYVSGYFEMDEDPVVSGDKLFIPMKWLNTEGSGTLEPKSNPISVAAWFFGRQNINPQMNDTPDPGGSSPLNLVDIGKSIVDNLDHLAELWKGANGYLKGKGIGRSVKVPKCWIRLLEPSGSKKGGGCRVKK
ncbi:hypothetical protein [Flavobacterium sp. 3HN19-14]|uniref:hypothetical protein n=1 Tax=Flavobacterium sp. 3HN19-14 TaxID=3448133 RepID=UPI003EE35260